MKIRLLKLVADVSYKVAISSGLNASYYDMYQLKEPDTLTQLVNKQLDKEMKQVNKNGCK